MLPGSEKDARDCDQRWRHFCSIKWKVLSLSKRHLLKESCLSLFYFVGLLLSLSPVYQPDNLFMCISPKRTELLWIFFIIIMFLIFLHETRVLVNAVPLGFPDIEIMYLLDNDLKDLFVCVLEYACVVQLCALEEVLWSTYDRVPCDTARTEVILLSLSAVTAIADPSSIFASNYFFTTSSSLWWTEDQDQVLTTELIPNNKPSQRLRVTFPLIN